MNGICNNRFLLFHISCIKTSDELGFCAERFYYRIFISQICHQDIERTSLQSQMENCPIDLGYP